MSQIKVAIVPVTPFQQNCSILVCLTTQKAAVVDPGGDIPLILRAIEQLGADVEKILLTHGHVDHAGGAAELAEALKVVVEGPHLGDKFLLDNLEQSGRMFGFSARDVAPTAGWPRAKASLLAHRSWTSCIVPAIHPARWSSFIKA